MTFILQHPPLVLQLWSSQDVQTVNQWQSDPLDHFLCLQTKAAWLELCTKSTLTHSNQDYVVCKNQTPLLKQTQFLQNAFESNLLTVDYSVEPDTSDNLLRNEWCARNCSSSTVHLSQSPKTPVLKLYSENKHIYSLLQQPGLVSMETIFLTTVSCLTRIKTKRLLWV